MSRNRQFLLERESRNMTMGLIIGSIVVLAGIVTYVRTVCEIRENERNTRR